MRRVFPRGRQSLTQSAIAATLLLATAERARAAECGGDVACGCGDTVVRDTILHADLGPCDGHGLRVASGVRLDGNGRRITGAHPEKDTYGIYLRGSEAAVVSDLTVSGFRHGVRLRSATGSAVRRVDARRNGDFAAHRGYGIDVSGDSVGNILQGNTIEDNADEGVHLGRGTRANQLVGNQIRNNHRENVYLLASDDNSFVANEIDGKVGFYVKDSNGNDFQGNVLDRASISVRGSSSANRFADNHARGAGFRFQGRRVDGVWSEPVGNEVLGGTIEGAGNCLRFDHARDNRVVGTTLIDCDTEVRSEGSETTVNQLIGVGTQSRRVSVAEPSRVVQTASGPRDLALTRVSHTRRLSMRRTATGRDGRIRVQIENRGPTTEHIADAAELRRLVAIELDSLGDCDAPVVEMETARHRFPIQLKTASRLSVAFTARFSCVNDPDRARRGSTAHSDYRIRARIAGQPETADADPLNDVCPRLAASDVTSGCGTAAAVDTTRDLLIDLVRRS